MTWTISRMQWYSWCGSHHVSGIVHCNTNCMNANKKPGTISSKSNHTDVRFLKLIFSGFLAFYKHVFKSVSFLLVSIMAWTLYKSFIKISVYQTSVINLEFQTDGELLNAWTGTVDSSLGIWLTCKQFWLPNCVL